MSAQNKLKYINKQNNKRRKNNVISNYCALSLMSLNYIECALHSTYVNEIKYS